MTIFKRDFNELPWYLQIGRVFIIIYSIVLVMSYLIYSFYTWSWCIHIHNAVIRESVTIFLITSVGVTTVISCIGVAISND